MDDQVYITLNLGRSYAWQSGKLWQDSEKRAAIMAAFWSKVHPADAKVCWPWRGGTNNRGYGWFSFPTAVIGRRQRVRVSAHRFAYLIARGPIPVGQEVCHHCDVTLCVNPTHLYVGSHQENHLDAVRKGRKRAWGLQKLNAEQVLAIRQQLANGALQRQIAKQYGIARNTVSQIANRKCWAHLPEAAPAPAHASLTGSPASPAGPDTSLSPDPSYAAV